MENKDKNKADENSIKNIEKNDDKSVDSKKTSQTPKIKARKSNIFLGKSKFGFPAPKKTANLSIELLTKDYDFYEKASVSNKIMGTLKSYSYNTFHGLFKQVNEDKIIVISQIKKPASSKMKVWPKKYYAPIKKLLKQIINRIYIALNVDAYQ